jgi:hypothetical protein
MLTGLGANVLANIVATATLSTIVVLLRARGPSVAYLLFWRSFSRDLAVIVSEVPFSYDPDIRPGEQPPLTPIGDALALAELMRFIGRRAHRPAVTAAANTAVFDRLKRQNLLIIGGPKYNRPCFSILAELNEAVLYQFMRVEAGSHKRARQDVDMKRLIARPGSGLPDLSPDSQSELDFGCTIVSRNPYNRRRRVVVVGGLSTLSTVAATTWLLRPHAALWWRTRIRARGFQAIITSRAVTSTTAANIRLHVLHYFPEEDRS